MVSKWRVSFYRSRDEGGYHGFVASVDVLADSVCFAVHAARAVVAGGQYACVTRLDSDWR